MLEAPKFSDFGSFDSRRIGFVRMVDMKAFKSFCGSLSISSVWALPTADAATYFSWEDTKYL